MNDSDEYPRFEHIQRADGSRYLRIQTEDAQFLVAVHGNDLDRLQELLDEPPTCL